MTRPTPFTIIVDTAEQLPFPFTNLRTDAEHDNELWDVKTVRGCLGRYPDSWGDYSVIGLEKRVAVERKSVSDLQNTILGFNDGHRTRFEGELTNLSSLDGAGLVVVEGTYLDVITSAPEFGKKTRDQNAKTLSRSILAYMADYNVAWQFSGDRDVAMYDTFHWLRRFWENVDAARRKATREKEREQRRLAKASELLQSRLFKTDLSNVSSINQGKV